MFSSLKTKIFLKIFPVSLEITQISVRGFCLCFHTVNDRVWFLLSAFSLDAEQPDYDLDSEDEVFVNKLKKKMDICPLQFEEMIDRLEKGSGQQVQLHCIYNECVCVCVCVCVYIYISFCENSGKRVSEQALDKLVFISLSISSLYNLQHKV